MWFNSTYILDVSTNIDEKLFSLLDKHFSRKHQLHKLFNHNNVKVSYSSLPNFKSVIDGHNKNILMSKKNLLDVAVRTKTSYPLKGSWQHKNLLYFCKVSTPDLKENHPHYIGFIEHTCKDRLYKHNSSFKYESKRTPTELSNFIWDKKKDKINVDLDCNILNKAKSYSRVSENACYVLQINIASFSLQRILNKQN